MPKCEIKVLINDKIKKEDEEDGVNVNKSKGINKRLKQIRLKMKMLTK